MKWHSKKELQEKFVKPTGENRKIIFIKKVDSKKVKSAPNYGLLDKFIE